MALTKDTLKLRIDQALGRQPADLVIKHARILDIVTGETLAGDVAICGDRIVGVYDSYQGKVTIDGRGATVVPGFIDSHVHVGHSSILFVSIPRVWRSLPAPGVSGSAPRWLPEAPSQPPC